MLPTVNGYDRAGYVTRPVAHEKRRQSADIVHIDQMMLRGGGGGPGEKFVEPVDPARGSGADWPWGDRVTSNAACA